MIAPIPKFIPTESNQPFWFFTLCYYISRQLFQIFTQSNWCLFTIVTLSRLNSESMQLMSQDAVWCWLNVECSNIPMFQCSNVPMFQSYNVQMFKEKSIPSKVKILSLKTFDCLEIVVWKGVLTAHWYGGFRPKCCYKIIITAF